MRSGFTIVRNGDFLGYPWKESLRSLAPLVDEVVVALGDSQDTTEASLSTLAQELPCRLVVLNSPWDATCMQGGLELSRQSNLALEACQHDVCFYLQGDEVLHEEDRPRLLRDLERFEKDDSVDALALEWIHFYGNFETFVHSRRWYRREIRVVKKSRGLRSYGDAQGFRIPLSSEGLLCAPEQAFHWKKPRAALSQAHCLHYGWVRPPEVMARKSEALDRLWHGSARDGQHTPENVYPPHYGMHRYTGTHPRVMQERISRFHSEFPNFDPFAGKETPWTRKNFQLWITDRIERLTGWRPGEYKNYASLKLYEDSPHV